MLWHRTESKLDFDEPRGNTWKHGVVNLSAVSFEDGKPISYRGWAYAIEHGSQGAALAGHFTSSAFRQAELKLQIALTEPAELIIFCNDRKVFCETLEVSIEATRPELRRISVDITKQKEPRVSSRVVIDVRFPEAPGELWLLADEDGEHRPRIEQSPYPPYTARAAIFFVSGWVSLFSLVVLGVTLGNFLNQPLLATPVAAASLILAYLGINSFAKLPVRDALRKVYSSVTTWPAGVAPLASILVSATLMAFAISCLNGSWRRFAYTNLIDEYVNHKDPERLVDAFAREPWRREAQLLFERSAVKERSTSRQAFRLHMRRLADDPSVREAIDSSGYAPPYYVVRNSPAVSDPILWFASILPEAYGGKEQSGRVEAVELLRKRMNCGADIQRLVLTIPMQVGKVPSEVTDASIAELNHLAERCAETPDRQMRSYSYQIQLAYDLLGNYSVLTDYEAAVSHFNKVLVHRRATVTEEHADWRAPHKLMVFHMFRFYAGDIEQNPGDPMTSRAAVVLKYRAENAKVAFGEVFKREVFDHPANEDFRDTDRWDPRSTQTFSELTAPFKNVGWRF